MAVQYKLKFSVPVYCFLSNDLLYVPKTISIQPNPAWIKATHRKQRTQAQADKNAAQGSKQEEEVNNHNRPKGHHHIHRCIGRESKRGHARGLVFVAASGYLQQERAARCYITGHHHSNQDPSYAQKLRFAYYIGPSLWNMFVPDFSLLFLKKKQENVSKI